MKTDMSAAVTEIEMDLGATVDYIKGEVTEKSDTFDFEELIAVEAAVRLVKKAADEALSLINTAKLRELEGQGSRQVGSTVYARVPKYTRRFRHDDIARAVRDLAHSGAADRESSELDLKRAVELAVKMMGDLYVAPATTAKIGTLDSLGIPKKQVIKKESKGHEIQVIDLESKDDDDDDE